MYRDLFFLFVGIVTQVITFSFGYTIFLCNCNKHTIYIKKNVLYNTFLPLQSMNRPVFFITQYNRVVIVKHIQEVKGHAHSR